MEKIKKIGQLLRHRFKLNNKPTKLVFEGTQACNSRCQLCGIWKIPKEKRLPEMTTEQIIEVFKDPYWKNLDEIILTGGEILLKKDLLHLVLSIHARWPKIKFSLSTNGLLPERAMDFVEGCLANSVKFDIGISLDAVGEYHDVVRGIPGNFKKVDLLIKSLVALRERRKESFPIVLGQTLHPLTVDHIQEVREYAKKRGVNYLLQMHDIASFYDNLNEGFNHTAGEVVAYRDKAIKEIKKLPANFQSEYLMYSLTHRKPFKFKCYALRSFFLLRANGNVAPCLRMANASIGNVTQQPIERIWAGHGSFTRLQITQCDNCANSWASGWSMTNCFDRFVPILARAYWRRLWQK